MIDIPDKVMFYKEPVDFRNQLDGLIRKILWFGDDPSDGCLYIFRNKREDRFKMVLFDTNGYWLLFRRLSSGKFKMPKDNGKKVKLSKRRLIWLLSGAETEQKTSYKPCKYKTLD